MNKFLDRLAIVFSEFKLIILIIISINVSSSYGQGVGINNTGMLPDSSAILDVSSIDKGIGLPIFNNISRDTMHNPKQGLLVYNTQTKELNIHFSGSWFELVTEEDVNTQASGVGSAGYVVIGNSSTPHHSAALDIISDGTHGFALPKPNTAAINNPTEGLFAAPGKFRFYDGEKWKTIESNTLGLSNSTGTAPEGYASIGTDTPELGASLAIESASQGVLPPRMTESERDAIPSPKEGLFIYNNSSKRLQFWTGTNWKGLLPLIDGIFSDDAGADPYGIFSLDSVDVSVYRDAWRDKPGNNNSSPCNTSLGSINVSSASITPPLYEQNGVLVLSAPSGGYAYQWTAPNDSLFIGQNITIPADEVIANLSGEWTLRVLNEDHCIASKVKIKTIIPLGSQHNKKGIFSGSTNNTDVHRLAWKDHPDSLNSDPCNSNMDLTTASIVSPTLEQQGTIQLNVLTPQAGAVYNWVSANDSVYTGTSITIPSDLSFATHNGDWSLSVTVGSCKVGGKLFNVKIGLQPNTQNKGIFSGTTNNNEVHRLAWKNHPDSLTEPPCTGNFNIVTASITAPSNEQTGPITLTAPPATGQYFWYSPNGSIYTGANTSITADSAFASHNGLWKLKIKEYNCVIGSKDISIHLALRSNVHDKGIFSGSSNNTAVHRLAWKDQTDSINTTPCTTNLDVTAASITSPAMEQQGNIVLNAPASSGTYTWHAPNGTTFSGNSTTVNADSVFASLNGEWTLKVEENNCLVGGKPFRVNISINDNHHNKGIFSGSTNNNENNRLSWKDAPDSLNLSPCGTAYVDISSALITPPSAEQNGVLTYNVTSVIGNTYTWTTPLGTEYTGANGTIPSDEVIANLNGEWKLVVTNSTSGCSASGKPMIVHFPMKQKSKEKGIFSGSTNNTLVYRNEWTRLEPLCTGLTSIFDLSSATITPPTGEQQGTITLNAPTGGTFYDWVSPNGTSYNGSSVTIPTNLAFASHSGEWSLVVKDSDRCMFGTKNIPLAIPLRTAHTSTGIFSGSSNNTGYRNNWKDISNNANTTP